MITFQIQNGIRIHARPAALLVNKANQFSSNITLKKDTKEANAKSLLNLLTLEASPGDTLDIQIEGADEQEAAAALKALFANELAKE